MPNWLPWIMPEDTSTRLEIGGYSIELVRLHLGNEKTIERNEKKYNDLLLKQSGRPRSRQVSLVFGCMLKATTIKRFRTIMRQFTGWPAILIYPDNTITHGIILDYYINEVSACQANIAITYELLRDYPQGEVQAI